MKTTPKPYSLSGIREAVRTLGSRIRAARASIQASVTQRCTRGCIRASSPNIAGADPAPSTPGTRKITSSLDHASTVRQAPRDTVDSMGCAPRRARVHLVVGPVGAGKSTFAMRLGRERAALRLTLDEWMVRLFRPDRPETGVVDWYIERAARSVDQIWSVAKSVTDLGTDVILEMGLLTRRERACFYQRVDAAGLPMTIHVLDADRDIRRARVIERNQSRGDTFSMPVPLEIFEFASDLWEPLESDECSARDVRFLRTDDP
jgi:predicted kinase